MGDIGYSRHKAIKDVSRSPQRLRRDSAAEGPAHLRASAEKFPESSSHVSFPFHR